MQPSSIPTVNPTAQPTAMPTQPTSSPSSSPSTSPSTNPTQPTSTPSSSPSASPSASPSQYPTKKHVTSNSLFSVESKLDGSFTYLHLILLLLLFFGLCTSIYYYFIRNRKKKDGSAESRWNIWKERQRNKDALNVAVNNITFNDEFGEFATFNPLPKVVEKTQKKKNKFVDNTLIVPQTVINTTEIIQPETVVDNEANGMQYNTIVNPLIKMGRNPLKQNPTIKIKSDITTTNTETRSDDMIHDVDL